MRDITIGKYLPLNSIIHHIDPRAKIMGMMFLLVATIIPSHFIAYIVLVPFVIVIYGASKLTFKYLYGSIRPLRFMMLFLLILNLFINKNGKLLFEIGGFTFYEDALIQTAFIIVRLCLMVAIATILTATTKPLDLTLGIEDLLSPFKKIGLPAEEFAMVISIALRFIPTLLEETQRIMNAQASRGVDFKEGKLKEKVVAIISLIIPLFISAFQRADDLANAMETRGYVPGKRRTRYRQLTWHLKDSVAITLSILLMVAMIWMRIVI